jgi:hypothetical protein
MKAAREVGFFSYTGGGAPVRIIFDTFQVTW